MVTAAELARAYARVVHSDTNSPHGSLHGSPGCKCSECLAECACSECFVTLVERMTK